MRVRASAGAASFRLQETMAACRWEAQVQVLRSAKERAAQERLERAMAALPEAQAAKERPRQALASGKRAQVTPARMSTTVQQARVGMTQVTARGIPTVTAARSRTNFATVR